MSKIEEDQQYQVDFWKSRADFWHDIHAKLSKEFNELEQENYRLRDRLAQCTGKPTSYPRMKRKANG